MTVEEAIAGLTGQYGVLVICILIGITGARGIWVWGWTYQAIVKDRDEWRELALTGQVVARRSLTLAKHAEIHETAEAES